VPNQDSQIKFLIREEFSVEFPESAGGTGRGRFSQNGTDGGGVMETKVTVSMGYEGIPFPGRETNGFPSWERRFWEALWLTSRPFPVQSLHA
jgi:hypothetical protein